MIGGMSWISTRTYYEYINQLMQKRCGPKASAPLLIDSLDYRDFTALDTEADWDRATGLLIDSARRLEQAGAEGIVITANAMHRVYDKLVDAVSIEVLHIADSTGERMQAKGASDAAILGTKAVMTESFFRKRLVSHGVDLLPPEMAHAEQLERLISQELKLGKKTRDAERTLKSMITWYEQHGAKAIVLACTELELVVDIDANVLPIYDTARIHCEAAIEWIDCS
ncbi:aspartate/glutamate racemase family protein [Erythrobacter litoralis]|uniref:Aspartate racemase n=1 Tax=Erythrobacter litoralis (strain HTCC2594) TaxID=314225 RepID=Q2NCM4_ERYLH|nr:amino acid racemase [Erythrobacter litoralis]ABC62567.1 Aspartate racemase [Erythrobacter litoralis HTCC2594]